MMSFNATMEVLRKLTVTSLLSRASNGHSDRREIATNKRLERARTTKHSRRFQQGAEIRARHACYLQSPGSTGGTGRRIEVFTDIVRVLSGSQSRGGRTQG